MADAAGRTLPVGLGLAPFPGADRAGAGTADGESRQQKGAGTVTGRGAHGPGRETPRGTAEGGSRQQAWLQAARRSRVIAAVRSVGDLEAVQASGVGVVFVLQSTIFDLRTIATACRRWGVHCFAHLDLVDGIGKDPAGVELLAREVGVDGLITTRSALIRDAKRVGLVAIQRLFLLDSASLATAVSVVKSTKPDAVEIMPALVVPVVAHRIPFADLPPVIAGGLVHTTQELQVVLASPAVAVSTSAKHLWAQRG